MEKQFPGSVSLSAGSCGLCRKNGCARRQGLPCRFPDKMRYSIEALGGNVGLTVTKYLKQELLWIEDNKLPAYFILVCGLLYSCYQETHKREVNPDAIPEYQK